MTSCEHPGGPRDRVCRHLLAHELGHIERFTGRGVERDYVCPECVDGRELVDVCTRCRSECAPGQSRKGIAGSPQIAEERSALSFEPRRVALALPAFADVQPLQAGARATWVGVTADGVLHRFDLDRGDVHVIARVPEALPADIAIDNPMLRISRDGRFAVVADRRGVRGVVLDLERGTALPLVRETEDSEYSNFPIAFIEREGRQLVVWGPRWNRLDIVDARTGEVLTPRGLPRSGSSALHDLDYFHADLHVSPDERWIADNGWVWHPVGVLTTWSLDRWLHDNVWESEDGTSRRDLCTRMNFCDDPLCWIDNTQLAVYGYGRGDNWLHAAVVYDVVTGDQVRWFPGPRGELTCDRELYAIDADGVVAWNVVRGTRLAHESRLAGARYHPHAKSFLSLADGVVAWTPRGHDALAPWAGGHVRELATRIAREQCFDELTVLGDALEVAGCNDADMIAHCHARHEHDTRCWVVDRLLHR